MAKTERKGLNEFQPFKEIQKTSSITIIICHFIVLCAEGNSLLNTISVDIVESNGNEILN